MTAWHVALIEPNRESTAAKHLKLLGVQAYWPVWARAYRQRSSGGRRWMVHRKALFPGYVFVKAQENLFSMARIAAGVRKRACPFLMSDGHPAVVSSGKIQELQTLEHTINLRRSERMKFAVGDRVLVREGLFSGAKATVHMLSDNQRIQVLLDFLGQQSRVVLAADQLDVAA